MTSPIFSLEQLDAVYKIEQDWLFEKLLEKLNAHRHLILSADQGWGVQEYVSELGFQLAEKHGYAHITRIKQYSWPVHTCFTDLRIPVPCLD